ncbi:MAG: YIP1 family protein [Candidatus Binatia bacterium]
MSDDVEFLPRQGPKGFVRVWKKIILDPQGFYQEMPSSGGFENPLIFLAVCAFFYLALKVIVIGATSAINALFLVSLVYIFGPGILMLASQFLFQGEGDYEGTLRICAYAGACLVLAWVPTLGIFAYLYSSYLIFLGTEKVHRLDTTKAAIVTLVAILVTAAIMVFVLGEGRVRRPLF